MADNTGMYTTFQGHLIVLLLFFLYEAHCVDIPVIGEAEGSVPPTLQSANIPIIQEGAEQQAAEDDGEYYSHIHSK